MVGVMSGGLIKVFGKKGLKIPAPELGAHEYANEVVLDPAAKLHEAKKLPPWQILGLDGVKVNTGLGATIIDTVFVAGQEPGEIVTLYIPLIVAVALAITGFWFVVVKFPGPVQV